MPEEGQEGQVYYEEQSTQQRSLGPWILIGVAVAYVLGSLYFIADMRGRVQKLERAQDTGKVAMAEVNKRLGSAEAAAETLASQLGITQKELAQRAAKLQRQQRAAEARLAQENAAQSAQLSQVSGEVAGVKTDVGGVKTDVASTKSELEATKAKLDRAIGDLGIQSGLIAHTRDDLEVLKHRGDRNYYEFTLAKSKRATPVSTVSLQLKKTDTKRGKYTMNVIADDRTIEKKDRTVGEPVQFYTGRERQLYELVVWTVDKNKVAGYLSTPKGGPVSVQQ